MSKQIQPPIKSPDVKPVKRLRMVDWYDPRRLAKTGLESDPTTKDIYNHNTQSQKG